MNAPAGSAAAPGRYLPVVLDQEGYALSVAQVREIIRLQRLTPVAQMRDFVQTALDLRGQVIPIIDLREKLGLPAKFTDRTCIVVVRLRSPARGVVQAGLVVDAVEEVATLSAADIEPATGFAPGSDGPYVLGWGRIAKGVKKLLAVNRVVAPEQVAFGAE